MSGAVNYSAKSATIAAMLATSWTYEKLLPSRAAFDSAVEEISGVCGDISSLAIPLSWPNWQTPKWYCRADRGVDIEFVSAAVGAGLLIAGLDVLLTRPIDSAAREIHRQLFHRV